MNIEKLRDYCLSLKGVTEEFPFDEETLVFKVMGKIFCLTSVNKPDSCNLKCEPERAIVLREEHTQIEPGFHMNKKHWNTIFFDGSLEEALFEELILHSYEQVVKGLPKKLQAEL